MPSGLKSKPGPLDPDLYLSAGLSADRFERRDEMLHKVTDRNYEKIIVGASVALLDFVSAWCSTCKHLGV